MADVLADDEVLYRRVVRSYLPADGDPPSNLAFRPNREDTDGISFYRAKHRTPVEIATPSRGGAESQFVGVLRAGDVRAIVGELIVDPADPGHVTAPQLNWNNRRDQIQEEWQVRLGTEACKEVVDPSETPPRRVWQQ